MSCLNELLTCWSECSIDVYRIPYFATVEIDAKQRSHSPYTVHHSTSFTFLAIFLQDKIYMYMGLIPKAIKLHHCLRNCSDVTMDAMASQITSLTVVYSTVYSGADKKKSKLRVTGLCAGNSPVTSEFRAQRDSNAENVSIWWRHHATDIWSHKSCCSPGNMCQNTNEPFALCPNRKSFETDNVGSVQIKSSA